MSAPYKTIGQMKAENLGMGDKVFFLTRTLHNRCYTNLSRILRTGFH